MLAFTSFSHQANPVGSKPKTAVKAKHVAPKPKTAVKAKVHVAKAVPVAIHAIKKLKAVAKSVKPAVKTPIKAGKHKAGPSKAQELAKKKKDEHKKYVKIAATMSTNKNMKIQQDLSKDKDQLKASLKMAKIYMRAQRKIRDDAKIKHDANKFIAANDKVNEFKDKIQAKKSELKHTVKKMSDVHAKLVKDKLALEKVTGKKAGSDSRKPHDIARLDQNRTIVESRRNKIFNLADRLARNKVF